jgi:hypothetical protein
MPLEFVKQTEKLSTDQYLCAIICWARSAGKSLLFIKANFHQKVIQMGDGCREELIPKTKWNLGNYNIDNCITIEEKITLSHHREEFFH